MSIKIKMAAASKVAGQFGWTAVDAARLPGYGGTTIWRTCAGDDDHGCSLDKAFWLETVTEGKGKEARKVTRPRLIALDEIAAHCTASKLCVEQAYMEKALTCTKTIDVADDGSEQLHTHGEACPRANSVEQDLIDAIDRVIGIEAEKARETDLLAEKA